MNDIELNNQPNDVVHLVEPIDLSFIKKPNSQNQ